jgi:hypothetical protein
VVTGFDSHPVTVDSSPGFESHPVTPPPVQPMSRGYHSARSGPALDDSRDEYCIIKYVQNLEKNTYKGEKHTHGRVMSGIRVHASCKTYSSSKCECEYVGRLRKSCLWMQQNFDSTMSCQ